VGARNARTAAAALALAVAAAAGAAARGPAAECAGDDCQVPPPPPAEVIPATAVVEGPPNPPVRFPQQRRHKHRAHGKASSGSGRGSR